MQAPNSWPILLMGHRHRLVALAATDDLLLRLVSTVVEWVTCFRTN